MQRRQAVIVSALRSPDSARRSSRRDEQSIDRAVRMVAEVVKKFQASPFSILRVSRLHALQRTDGRCAAVSPRISGARAAAQLPERF